MKAIIIFPFQIFLFMVLTILYTGQINAQKSTTETYNGLRTAKFKTDEGTITVYTPADMHAGDVISGTVYTEPEGKNNKEVKKNQDVLNGYVIEMQDKKTPIEKGEEKWQIPTFFAGLTTLLLLKDENGKVIGTAEVPVDSIPRSIIPDALSENTYLMPDYIQAGKPFQIPGYYDGDFLTTGMTINGISPTILAESPGVTIYEAPPDIVGPSGIELTEGDLIIKDSLNVLSVNLTASKLNLLKGEKTKVTVNILGLKGLEKDVTYFIENKTMKTIGMEGGDEQDIIIKPDSVSSKGIYTKDFSVTAKEPGTFTIWCSIVPLTRILPLIRISKSTKYFIFEKSVNSEFSKIGDILTYTITIKHNSDIKPTEIIIEDLIPEGTELVGDISLEQIRGNGTTCPFRAYDSQEIPGGIRIEIEHFPVSRNIKITFSVKIVDFPEGGVITNKGLNFTLPEQSVELTEPPRLKGKMITICDPPEDHEIEDGTETTVLPNISISKTVEVYDEYTTECGPGDSIRYTITIKNNENEDVNVPIYDLIPNNVKSEPPPKLIVNDETVENEILEHTDWNQYLKYTITIPANSSKKITYSYKVFGYGAIENKIYTFKLPDNNNVKPEAENKIESNEETYLKNTYKREFANIIKHKDIANRIHSINYALDLLYNGHIEFERDCNGIPVKIYLTFIGFGNTPRISSNRVDGDNKFTGGINENNELIFHFNTTISYTTILKYDSWRKNKAVFYHELLHIQLQLENWNNDDWWDKYCTQLSEWKDKNLGGNPPSVLQSEAVDHGYIGVDQNSGWHKEFLDELKNIDE